MPEMTAVPASPRTITLLAIATQAIEVWLAYHLLTSAALGGMSLVGGRQELPPE